MLQLIRKYLMFVWRNTFRMLILEKETTLAAMKVQVSSVGTEIMMEPLMLLLGLTPKPMR